MLKKLALVIAAVGISAGVAIAATNGSDFANDPAYDMGFGNGTDGGTPLTFSSWIIGATPPGPNAGSFIGDSTSLAPMNTGGNVNTGGEAFGLFAHSGQSVDASRSFDSPLGGGQTFTIQLAVNFRNGNKGFDLRDASSASIFNLNIGGDTYAVNNATTGNGVIFGGTYDANTVFSISMTQVDGTGGTWSITRSGGLTGTVSGTYTGLASGFHLYNSQTTGAGAAEDNLFFNNMTVIPEPSTYALLAGPTLLGAFMFIRRRRS
jgi:hypothetical protein